MFFFFSFLVSVREKNIYIIKNPDRLSISRVIVLRSISSGVCPVVGRIGGSWEKGGMSDSHIKEGSIDTDSGMIVASWETIRICVAVLLLLPPTASVSLLLSDSVVCV